MDIGIIIALTISFFLILHPFASVPLFLKISDGLDQKTMRIYADKAVFVATVLLLIFILFGDEILSIFEITLDTFRVAGGIVLLMMAIEMIFSLKLSKLDVHGAAWAIIATPVLTGPGIITAAIIASFQNGLAPVLIASIIALLATWVTLRLSPIIMKLVGEQALDISTKVVGLFIAAMGVSNIFVGSANWFVAHAHIVMF